MKSSSQRKQEMLFTMKLQNLFYYGEVREAKAIKMRELKSLVIIKLMSGILDRIITTANTQRICSQNIFDVGGSGE